MSQEEAANLTPSGGTLTAPPAIKPTVGVDRMANKKQRSLWGNAWRQYRKHHMAMVGLVVFISLCLLCFVGSQFYPKAIDEIDFSVQSASFTSTHPFGTDSLGQDMLARILWGGRISIAVGVTAAMVAIIIGTMVGAIAGFFGGTTDSILMRVTDGFLCLPQLPLLLLITFLFRDSLVDWFDAKFNNGNLGVFVLIVIVIARARLDATARIVRASFCRQGERVYRSRPVRSAHAASH